MLAGRCATSAPAVEITTKDINLNAGTGGGPDDVRFNDFTAVDVPFVETAMATFEGSTVIVANLRDTVKRFSGGAIEGRASCEGTSGSGFYDADLIFRVDAPVTIVWTGNVSRNHTSARASIGLESSQIETNRDDTISAFVNTTELTRRVSHSVLLPPGQYNLELELDASCNDEGGLERSELDVSFHFE